MYVVSYHVDFLLEIMYVLKVHSFTAVCMICIPHRLIISKHGAEPQISNRHILLSRAVLLFYYPFLYDAKSHPCITKWGVFFLAGQLTTIQT